jgi:hypothetical protein
VKSSSDAGSCQKSVDELERVAETGALKVYPSDWPIVEVRNMGKKATVLVTACVMIVVVIFFEFFVFRTLVQQTKDPYFTAYYDEFNKTPTPAYDYSFSPPVSMYHALLIALESGGWNETSLKNRTIRVELDYYAFVNDPSNNATLTEDGHSNTTTVTVSTQLYRVTQSVVDWSPQQINDTTTYRYVWKITVLAKVYGVDAATAELVFTWGLIPMFP